MPPPIVLISCFPFDFIIILLLIYYVVCVVDIGRFVRFWWFVIIEDIGIGDTLFLLIYCVDICCFIFLFVHFVILYLYCQSLVCYFCALPVPEVHCVHITIHVITAIYFWGLLLCLPNFPRICTTMRYNTPGYSIFNPISLILVSHNLHRFRVLICDVYTLFLYLLFLIFLWFVIRRVSVRCILIKTLTFLLLIQWFPQIFLIAIFPR